MDTLMKNSILIVEDDELVRNGLFDILSSYDYEVFCASDAKEAMLVLEQSKLHLIILDVNLGEVNGFELCKKIRGDFNTPIMFLTACDTEFELVQGFSIGGDDYITKPFRLPELLARIKALIRRGNEVDKTQKIYTGDWCFDFHQIYFAKNEMKLVLTPIEMKLLKALIEAWPNVVSRQHLLYEVWDKDALFVEENTLSVNILRLREKLGTYNQLPYIETIRGVGYQWNVSIRG